MRKQWIAGVVLCAAFVGAASADEVLFKNGDCISGKIERLDGGKLIITSKVAGELKVDLADVKTFSTDGPIAIQLKDGTVINQKAVAGDEGTFKVGAEGALQPQSFPIANVAKVNPPKEKWTGDISAGAMFARGNTNSDSANVGLNLARRGEIDRLTFGGGYFYSRQKDPTTGEKVTVQDNWFAMLKYDYFFTEKFYGYGMARIERDRIANLDLRFLPGVGVGYQWIESADLNFLTEGGLTWTYEKFDNDTDSRSHLSLRLAYHVDKKFNDKVGLFHNLAYYPSLESFGEYYLTTDAGVRATLTKSMFGEFKVQLNHDSNPAEGAKKNDLRYILSLGWQI